MIHISGNTLFGPVHSQQAIDLYKKAVEDAKQQGGTIQFGGKV